MRTIDADALCDRFSEMEDLNPTDGNNGYLNIEEIYEVIDNAPTVETDKELNEKIETYKNAYRIMSDAFENEVRKNQRPQSEQKCVTCKYRGCGFTEKPCRECSRSYANLYEEAENETDN